MKYSSEFNDLEGAPSVFHYEDYREFLRDTYTHLKRTKPAFSYRYFARKAGLSSPNYYKLIVENKRNLTPKSIQQFAGALDLGREESEFFENLVLFNQAKDSRTKNYYYEKLKRTQGYVGIHAVEEDHFEFFSKWYYTVIRELVSFQDFSEDPKWIAERIRPSISETQAQEGLQLLLRLNLIKRDVDGKLILSEAVVATGPEVRSLAISNFHRQMLSQASHSIDEVSSDRRDISALTLGVNEEQLQMAKQRILEFRRSLLQDIAGADKVPDNVYQLTVQFFPLTEKEEKKD